MKTDDLIAMLASHAAPPAPRQTARRFGLALLFGAAGALMVLAAVLGIRNDFATMAATPVFWGKLAFPAVLALSALPLVLRLGHPGMKTGKAGWLPALPLTLVWLAALAILLDAPQAARAELVLGHSWAGCLVNIALLSVPTLAATIWAMQGLAPTRPRLAGAASGLLAGALAATVYALSCREMAVPFWASWYPLGILLPVAAGALIGPRFLRW